jgi:uncharacterized repeat protein (TIGR04138 family)
MQQIHFEEVLERILQQDSCYHRDAYFFLREALEHTQKIVGKANKGQIRHVSGQELLNGIREYALEQFGPMTLTVFEEWGIRSCDDFGEMVFKMVEHNLLAKTDKDSRDDFRNGYDFKEAFCKPFTPASSSKAKPKAAQA